MRPVNDFSQFLINSAVTCHEKIDLESIDHICATARHFLERLGRRHCDEHCWLTGSDTLAAWKVLGSKTSIQTTSETPGRQVGV